MLLFIAFLQSTITFEHFEKKNEPHPKYFWNYWLRKTWLLKCIRGPEEKHNFPKMFWMEQWFVFHGQIRINVSDAYFRWLFWMTVSDYCSRWLFRMTISDACFRWLIRMTVRITAVRTTVYFGWLFKMTILDDYSKWLICMNL